MWQIKLREGIDIRGVLNNIPEGLKTILRPDYISKAEKCKIMETFIDEIFSSNSTSLCMIACNIDYTGKSGLELLGISGPPTWASAFWC